MGLSLVRGKPTSTALFRPAAAAPPAVPVEAACRGGYSHQCASGDGSRFPPQSHDRAWRLSRGRRNAALVRAWKPCRDRGSRRPIARLILDSLTAFLFQFQQRRVKRPVVQREQVLASPNALDGF